MVRILFFCIFFMRMFTIYAQPTLNWRTYYGGHYTCATAIHYDEVNDYIYIAGFTADTVGVATPGSYKSYHTVEHVDSFWVYHNSYANNDNAMFLAKFDLMGNRIWGTYFGGVEIDMSLFINTDHDGNIIISSATETKTGIATMGTHLSTLDSSAAFIAKFSPDGDRLWGTYFGQIDTIHLNGLQMYGGFRLSNVSQFSTAFDAENNIYLVGSSSSSRGVATSGTHQQYLSIPDTTLDLITLDTALDRTDVFLSKFTSDGIQVWGTYFGGGNLDVPSDIVYCNSGHVYIVGNTFSDSGIATKSAYGYEFNNSASFIAKFDTSGLLIWSTYCHSRVVNIVTDQDGNIYVTGHISIVDTTAYSMITSSRYSDSISGFYDLYLMKLTPDGELLWSTFIGSAGIDRYPTPSFGLIPSTSLRYAADDNALYFAGSTDGLYELGNECNYQPISVAQNGIIVKFDTAGHKIWISRYDDAVSDIAIKEVSGKNKIFIVGKTRVPGLATPGAHQPTKAPDEYSSYIAAFDDMYFCDSNTLSIYRISDTLYTDMGYDSYTWYYNGIAVHTGSYSYYVPGMDTIGNYYVVGEQCGCYYRSDTFIIHDIGVHNPKFSNNIKVYPNPSSSTLIVDMMHYATNASPIILTIYNSLGQLQSSEIIASDNQPIAVDISSLFTGFYILKIQVNDQILYKQFVKE